MILYKITRFSIGFDNQNIVSVAQDNGEKIASTTSRIKSKVKSAASKTKGWIKDNPKKTAIGAIGGVAGLGGLGGLIFYLVNKSNTNVPGVITPPEIIKPPRPLDPDIIGPDINITKPPVSGDNFLPDVLGGKYTNEELAMMLQDPNVIAGLPSETPIDLAQAQGLVDNKEFEAVSQGESAMTIVALLIGVAAIGSMIAGAVYLFKFHLPKLQKAIDAGDLKGYQNEVKILNASLDAKGIKNANGSKMQLDIPKSAKEFNDMKEVIEDANRKLAHLAKGEALFPSGDTGDLIELTSELAITSTAEPTKNPQLVSTTTVGPKIEKSRID